MLPEAAIPFVEAEIVPGALVLFAVSACKVVVGVMERETVAAKALADKITRMAKKLEILRRKLPPFGFLEKNSPECLIRKY